MRHPALDPESFALAEHFLPNGTEDELNQLASVLQEAVEEWLQENTEEE